MVRVSDCVFNGTHGNTSGVVAVESGGEVVFERVAVYWASSIYGAVYSRGVRVSLMDCVFAEMTTAALFTENAAVANIHNCTVTRNTGNSGVLFGIQGSSLTVAASTFTDNSAFLYSTIQLESSSLSLVNCSIADNWAGDAVVAVNGDSDVTVAGSVFTGSTVDDYGTLFVQTSVGSIFMVDSTIEVSDRVVTWMVCCEFECEVHVSCLCKTLGVLSLYFRTLHTLSRTLTPAPTLYSSSPRPRVRMVEG